MELRIKTVSEVLQQLSTVVVVVAKVVDRLTVLPTLKKVRLSSDPNVKAPFLAGLNLSTQFEDA